MDDEARERSGGRIPDLPTRVRSLRPRAPSFRPRLPTLVLDRPHRTDPRVHVWPFLRPLGGRFLRDWLAITLFDDTFAWRALSASELAHESTHMEQWRQYGLRFVARYLRASWQARQVGGDWYRDNRFEIAARVAARHAAEAEEHRR